MSKDLAAHDARIDELSDALAATHCTCAPAGTACGRHPDCPLDALRLALRVALAARDTALAAAKEDVCT